jgi:hypothetical protein
MQDSSKGHASRLCQHRHIMKRPYLQDVRDAGGSRRQQLAEKLSLR